MVKLTVNLAARYALDNHMARRHVSHVSHDFTLGAGVCVSTLLVGKMAEKMSFRTCLSLLNDRAWMSRQDMRSSGLE